MIFNRYLIFLEFTNIYYKQLKNIKNYEKD